MYLKAESGSAHCTLFTLSPTELHVLGLCEDGVWGGSGLLDEENTLFKLDLLERVVSLKELLVFLCEEVLENVNVNATDVDLDKGINNV